MQRSAISFPEPSIHASPSGSVSLSASSCEIVEIAGSAGLSFGRGFVDWQWPATALYGMSA
jgi:hypothetical protein